MTDMTEAIFNPANPDYAERPTLTIDGFTIIVTGTDEKGISLSVQSDRELTGQWAAQERSIANRANFSAQRAPLPVIVTPADNLADDVALVYTARYTPWERDPNPRVNQMRRFWQQTIHRDWCRHAKGASILTASDRKELAEHGFKPYYKHGGSQYRFHGCRVCHTANFTKGA
jgi:hypothetical protein